MPFIRGAELFKIRCVKRFLSENEVKFYTVQLVLAIGYLHDSNIAHRDLKCENILVQQNGYLKLIDYGLAKKIEDDELTMSICGTAEYLAPETINNAGSDKAVDWWALGIIMYELLIGLSPFYHSNRMRLFN